MAEPLKESTQRLNELLCGILSRTRITPDMVDSAFLLSWEKKQHKIIDENVLPMLNGLEKISAKLFEQCSVTKSRPLQFDKEKMIEMGLMKKSQYFDPQIEYDKLLEWFVQAMPDLINAIYFKPPCSIEKLKREEQIVSRIIVRADDLLDRIDFVMTDSERLHNQSGKTEQSSPIKSVMLSYLNEKLILTPPIDMVTKKPRRITIWEAMPAIDSPSIGQRNAVKVPDGNQFDIITTEELRMIPLFFCNLVFQMI